MTAYLTDPYLWGLLALMLLAVVTWLCQPLLELTGWVSDVGRLNLPPWLVVVGGWGSVIMAVWGLVELWRGLGWLVGR